MLRKLRNKKQNTYVALVLDQSWSMHWHRARALQTFNSILDGLRDGANKNKESALVSVVLFSDFPKMVIRNRPVDKINPIVDYHPNGSTALFDAVGDAIEALSQFAENDPDASFLVITITDGEENKSRGYNATKLLRLIRSKQATGRWTITFQVPPGHMQELHNTFRIPKGNIREWEFSEEGFRKTETETLSSIDTYFHSRARGLKASKTFYTTDLSKVTPTKVRRSLDDISGDFKEFVVSRETSIREFVESKTRRPYVIGSAYYQLMKPEKVQANKKVLLQEKGKAAVWGGQEARDLVGLPRGVQAEVHPGNHANWDIFVESRSVNRILPRGTRVLVNMTKTRSAKPTWDHAGARR